MDDFLALDLPCGGFCLVLPPVSMRRNEQEVAASGSFFADTNLWSFRRVKVGPQGHACAVAWRWDCRAWLSASPAGPEPCSSDGLQCELLGWGLGGHLSTSVGFAPWLRFTHQRAE